MDFGAFPAGMPGGGVSMIPKMTRGIMRRNVDYTSCVITYLENRIWQRGKRDRPIIQPDVAYVTKMVAPVGSVEDPVTAITTKFVKTVYNKQRCPIFCTTWSPDGRRLIAGAASGEFSLWNGVNLNFEALMKSHESSVRSMKWSHNGMWMATTDDRGLVKYWQSNMNNVHSFQAHNETIRGCSFSPTDAKLATCSDDGTVRVFDFLRSSEEFILRGHGADVKCVDWHPRKNLLVSGSKDNQQPVKLWDPKAGQSVSTIHAHKAAVTSVQWNRNGNWLLTASRDHLIKLYDIRTMKELEVLKGHKSDVNAVSWHPIHEKLFTSGGSDGAILFWLVGNKRDIGGMESPHDSFVWSLSWHPLGHMLCSGSNDHTCKFWCRNRPGDEMKDRHSSGGLPVEEMAETDIFESSNQMQGGNISLPPPSKNPILPPPLGRTTGQPSVGGKPAGNVHLQVLGADIIKEQFGEPAGPPGGQTQGTQPAKSGLFMHLQGGEGKEGGGPPPQPQPPPGDFGSPFQPSGFPSHQNPPLPSPGGGRGGGLGSPDVRGPPPSQNFHGPRPPPHQMQQQQQHGGVGGRREWGEGGPDFRPPFPGRDFPPHHLQRQFRPSSHLASNPFSWQRQDPNREQMAFEEEGVQQRFQEGHNPYVFRREEGRLRDPREQRLPPPPGPGGVGRGGGEDLRRPSQDDGGPEWHNNRGPWQQPQEHHHGGGGGRAPPGHPREPEFHDRESKPPTQEHFDQQRGPDFVHPRDRSVEQFPPPGHHLQDRPGMDGNRPFREGENWRPPFCPEGPPPHEGPPPQRNFQGLPPPHQEPRFPLDELRIPPQGDPRDSHPDHDKRGPITPTATVSPQVGGEGGHVHDPRSQRPPTSQGPPFPPGDPQQRFPREVPPNMQDSGGPPNIREGGPLHPMCAKPAHDLPPQSRDPPTLKPQDGPPPHVQDGLPGSRDGVPPHIPPQHREGPPPPQFRDGPPQMLPRDSPAHHPPHMRDGPPNMQQPNRDVPQELRDGPPHHLPRNLPDGPPHLLREGPPQHGMIRNGPPQQIPGKGSVEVPPQHNIREGPPHMPPQVRGGPPQQIHDGPPMNSPQHLNAPPQRFDEFHGPPRGDQFFHSQEGGPNSPRPGNPPQRPFMPPHSHSGPPMHVDRGPPDGGPRFSGPPHMGREQEHFHSPQHFPEPQGPPPNMHRPPPQHFSGPPPPHGDQIAREPGQNNFNQFPPDPQRPPHHPGPSDPRRQHPPQNFPDRAPPPGLNERDFPPHHPHHQPHRQEGAPVPPQSGDPGWNQRPFPRDSGGRFDGNRDPSRERRSGGGGSRVEGRDKREREREREGRGGRGARDKSPKHHGSSARDGQLAAKRSRGERDSSKHSSTRREKSSRK